MKVYELRRWLMKMNQDTNVKFLTIDEDGDVYASVQPAAVKIKDFIALGSYDNVKQACFIEIEAGRTPEVLQLNGEVLLEST